MYVISAAGHVDHGSLAPVRGGTVAVGLDLGQVAPRLHELLPGLRRLDEERRAALASLPQQAMVSHPLPSMPAEHTVLATDGSQIEPDRHAAFPCYLINLGQVVLRYGPQPYAHLSSQAHVAITGLPVEPENEGDEEGQVERLYLDLERSVAELRGLLELATDSSAEHPVLALQDGSLILWVATAMRYQRETDRYVSEYVACLEELRVLAQTRPLALASYISHSNSYERVTKLRMETSQNGSAGHRTYGEPLDRDLFASLQPGQRSDIYRSERGILEKYAPENRISFFYVNVGPEIGRVELPLWAAENPALVDFTHAAVYDQCRRSNGYPVALMEAHEQAVVSPAESRDFWRLANKLLQGEGLPVQESAKAISKRVPWA